jgi:hypothetical protein
VTLRALGFGLGALVAASSANAQIVRGVATERASGTALSGVLVVLERSVSTDRWQPEASTLTREAGDYALRAPAPGRYRVTAKRIGVQRHVSSAFDLSAGETRELDITLEAVVYNLPPVVVAEAGFCVARPEHRSRVASLWDEVRTALTATQISLRDRLFQGHLSRYVRELDPRSLRVLSESRSETKGILDRPFTNLSGDSLSRVGYWRTLSDGTAVYDAPDAAVLLSDAFERDHCYGAADGGRTRRGLVGLSFEPAPGRDVADVRGTIWLDARTFELRFVEYRYTRIDLSVPGANHVGGELHFARFPNGAWSVRRWFIRMPQYGRYAASPVGADGRTPSVVLRPTVFRLLEEGGEIFAEGLRLFERPAAVQGNVVDSTGQPFGAVVVRIGGTPFADTSDAAGRFRLDSLPGGRFTLVAEHASYAALGSVVTDETVQLEEGTTVQVTLRATKTDEIIGRLCEGQPRRRGRGTLRLLMVDSTSATPLPSLSVWLRWPQNGLQSMTDARGVVTFCDLPSDVPLELVAVRPTGQAEGVIGIFRLRSGELAAHTVPTTRRR